MTPKELAREIEDADSHDDDDTVILRVGLYRKLLATAEREAKQSIGHTVYCQLIGNGMPEGMGHEDQAKWLWTRFSDYRQGIADLTEREAKLREAAELLLSVVVGAICRGMPVTQQVADARNKAVAALESKGGES